MIVGVESGIDYTRCAAMVARFLAAGSPNPLFVSVNPAPLLSYVAYFLHRVVAYPLSV